MIHDGIGNARLYLGLGDGIRAALGWLREHGAACAPGDPIPVADGVTARPARYMTHASSPSRYEFHRRFIDVQFVAEGEETVLVAPVAGTRASAPFDEAADVGFGTAEGMPLTLRAGEFLILWPHEAHQPGVSTGAGPVSVRKIVVKVAVGQAADRKK